ncbi:MULTISPECIES: GNAT family N-acetyltransferase [unclassified Rhizobium]|uniref:GNAT family N-acetyltransferase n=1 Tax=unclassified Rhizobium TaxID=2613769 RepID=UPI000646C5A9|nr:MULTISPECIES: GNAT family N-acetyltransferase [unclassified Rhizobium]MBN8952018.1 GNAT family N-acetyltransferase [Rhizobium tropici]OJY78107.1 MAG: GNAT family N-acetyltransferase [Rhizobium sp. 60-20]RKD56653.1 RimJ/RimL family protein N-acetyltransferase [Rhizobium sp. WW_1]
MQHFSIRRLQRDDTSLFREIRLEGLNRHPEAFGASHEEEEAYSLAQIGDRIESNAVFGGFADDGALVGVVAVARSRGVKMRHIATIWGMYVRPQGRGTGLSRLLMVAALDEARRTCRSIRLTVVSSNAAAIRLYESLGFKAWAVDIEALKVGDTYHDEILMRLDTDA